MSKEKKEIIWFDPINSDAQYLNVVACAFRDSGYKVTVISNVRNLFPLPEGVNWIEFSLAFARLNKTSVFLWKILTFVFYPLSYVRAIYYLNQRKMKNIIMTSSLKIPKFDIFAVYLMHMMGIKVFYVCHKPHPNYYDNNGIRLSKKYRKFFETVDGIIVMTEYTGKLLKEYYKLSSTPIYEVHHPSFNSYLAQFNTDDDLLLKLREASAGRKVISIVSNWTSEHGIEKYLDKISYMDSFSGDVFLIFVVKSNDPGVEKKIREAVLRNLENVPMYIRTSSYSYGELLSVLEITDLVVVPYQWATQSGVVVLANTLGVPAVVTNVGGLPEMIKDGINGYTLHDLSESELRNTVSDVLFSGRFGKYKVKEVSKKMFSERGAVLEISRILNNVS